MNIELEKLIDLAIADGIITDKKKQVLEKKREELGVDLDEFEMVLEAKLHQRNQVNTQTVFPNPPLEKNSKQEAIDNLGKMNIPYNQGTLIFHAQEGNLSVVKLLLEAGLNPNIIYIEKVDKKDVSFLALDRAITKGHIEIVKLLIEYGADLNYFDETFSKPINKAIQTNNIELLNLLIGKGADITKGNNIDENIPIIQAIKLKNIEIVQILAPKIELNFVCSPTWSKATPLIYSIETGQNNITKILIENGADVNLTANTEIESPLIVAIKNKNLVATKLLIENGADVNKASKDGSTPLYIAHHRKIDALVMILIKSGAIALTESELLKSSSLSSKAGSTIEYASNFGKKTFWFAQKVGFAKILSVVICLSFIGYCSTYESSSSSSSSSSSGSSSSSNSSETQTCEQCGNTFSGSGWLTVGGEQYQPSNYNGYGYCSRQCAYDSQPSKWK